MKVKGIRAPVIPFVYGLGGLFMGVGFVSAGLDYYMRMLMVFIGLVCLWYGTIIE